MPDYPLQLNLQQRLCVVVGAGNVGLRKVEGLLAAGARVRVVSPTLPTVLPAALELVERPYRSGDLVGALLAFAATSDPQVNALVAADARAAGILVNLADDPAQGDFALPAVLRRGELTLTVATGGGSPALAALLKEQLADQFGGEWEAALAVFAALRRKRLTVPSKGEYNREILRRLLCDGLPGMLAAGDTAGADRLLGETAGVSLETLGIRLSKGKP